MSTLYADKFHSKGNEYEKKLVHFHCKCKEKNILYVLFCYKHPYRSPPIPQTEKKLHVSLLLHQPFVFFFDEVKYLLNLELITFE